MKIMLIRTLLIIASGALLSFSAWAQKFATAADEVCWKHSLTRPVEGIPQNCPGGQHQAGLCYPNCSAGGSVAKDGFTGVGVVCWANCPQGWYDHGAGCTKPNGYRTTLYPWGCARGDLGGGCDSVDGRTQMARCEREKGGGNCEWSSPGLLYDKCRPGFRRLTAIDSLCVPVCPQGWADTGATCIKPTETRPVSGIPTCNPGIEYQAGLCYKPCAAGYDGVGVVCWGRCDPAHPVDCGALCGRTQADCAKAITEQVVAVLEVIGNVVSTVATAGASTGATAGAKAAAAAAKSSGKAAIGNAMKSTAKSVSKSAFKATVIKVAKDAGKSIAESTAEQLAKAAAGEEFDWAALDPTGIASVVQAFNKPICQPPQQQATAAGAAAGSSAGGGGFAFGSLIKANTADAVYLVNRIGQKQHVTDINVFNACGLSWGPLQTLDPGRVNAVPTGPALSTAQACQAAKAGAVPAGTIVKASNAPTVYLVSAQGQKLPIASPQVFDGCGLQWPALVTADPAAVAAIPSGAALSTPQACLAAKAAPTAAAGPAIAPGTLIKPSDGPAVYMVGATGQKHHITDGNVFTACGLQWGAIQTLSPAQVNAVPTGTPLASPQACVAARAAAMARK